jgi:hypothetical protein
MPERVAKFSFKGADPGQAQPSEASNRQVWDYNGTPPETQIPEFTYEVYRIDEIDQKLSPVAASTTGNSAAIEVLQGQVDALQTAVDALAARINEIEDGNKQA